MNKLKFKLDLGGLRELMKSDDMQSILSTTADSVANKARTMTSGEDFGTDVRVINYVAVGTIFPQSEKAAKQSYQDNILEKALNGLPRTKGGK